MTKDEEKIKDWRSTGRRKARRALYTSRIDYKCVDCYRTVLTPPKDAPTYFDELWPEANRVLKAQLEADHETKDLTDNDPDHLNWRCDPCHWKHDHQTAKGESTVKETEIF